MMSSQGPSPWIPLLMVGVLSFVAFGNSMMSIAEVVLPFLQPGDEDEDEGGNGDGDEDGATMSMFLPIILLLLMLVHFLAVFSPKLSIFSAFNRRSESSGYDADGFGLGSLLLLALFFVLLFIF
ncbi:hypothetical protein Vadar_028779 [Vaccinium darrowii]|uniref:Uncharacterized protein n=1 Tax=Vaccinium darrowii TaxID=229202 RepID=A0ACB7ZET3_9ERIC|nr:hypothetical protein Vadar_028779 [Vaccinium darrowii]